MSETARRTGNVGCCISVPKGPISGALHTNLIEMAVHMQSLPPKSFEVANIAYKNALAEVERVAELEQQFNGELPQTA
ncbi:hypothetical protein [Halodesulfovibrio aestuarii]|uniref:Uncharacterized protein n=1 Tax=Halodesulfovibrio aestuarii TaxID=126333 RepID=A0A8G2C7A0_9BACT|nr:hypothetical protein [Halodesulfovibrio aestuarii]SHI60053.1 hypothetical protein SAMN05660830_00423 [Halodesulfovibrio aestuarii]